VLVDQAAWPADIAVEEVKAERTKLDEELNKLAAAPAVEASVVENLTQRRDWAQARIDAATTK
jgi:hypothetical protein